MSFYIISGYFFNIFISIDSGVAHLNFSHHNNFLVGIVNSGKSFHRQAFIQSYGMNSEEKLISFDQSFIVQQLIYACWFSGDLKGASHRSR